MDRDPQQKSKEIHPGMSQDQVARHLLNDIRNPVDRVRQGFSWMDMNGYSTTQAPHVATIIINNAMELVREIDRLKRGQEMSNPNSPQNPALGK